MPPLQNIHCTLATDLESAFPNHSVIIFTNFCCSKSNCHSLLSKSSATPQYSNNTEFILAKDKEINQNQTVVLNDMELTVGQINEARKGKKFRKWGNARREKNTLGVVPYKFSEDIIQKERDVVEIILRRFNKDLKGCVSIR